MTYSDIIKTASALPVPRAFTDAKAAGNDSVDKGTGRADAELK